MSAANLADASGRPASLCTLYSRGARTLSLKGHCASRDTKNPNRCTTSGKATWCGVAMRGRS